MITVQEATTIILDQAITLPAEEISLDQASGRILAESLPADRDFPPFDRVTMDGIAILYDAFALGRRSFPLSGIQAAGLPQQQLSHPDEALEVMTGAVMPAGADTVVRYEDVQIADNQAVIVTDAIVRGQNIHRKGTDRSAGETIVPAGQRVSAAEIAIAATIGKNMLRVLRLPRIAILSTGDELVPVSQTPLPHQIRMSNAYAIQALLSPWASSTTLIHLPDQLEASVQVVRDCLQHHDIIILSGGVSAGKFDFIPQAMDQVGVRTLFHQVAQRPGKPFWFGVGSLQQVVFALPGNPVSAFVGTIRYVIPFIRQCLGLSPAAPSFAVLSDDFTFKPNLTYFLQVKLKTAPDGITYASPLSGKGSGDFANLTDTDGFLELPRGRDIFHRGEVFPCWPYR
jgi:molybdopterin molybdotransferase